MDCAIDLLVVYYKTCTPTYCFFKYTYLRIVITGIYLVSVSAKGTNNANYDLIKSIETYSVNGPGDNNTFAFIKTCCDLYILVIETKGNENYGEKESYATILTAYTSGKDVKFIYKTFWTSNHYLTTNPNKFGKLIRGVMLPQ